MKIKVKSLKAKRAKSIEVPDGIFDYPYKEHLIHTAVQSYLAKLRSGTHATKTRAEITGTGGKPWRQKGTGRARAGTRKSPLWRSGGTAHGPQPRSYENGLSVQEKKNALKSALSRKLVEDGIVVLDSLELESPKTGELARQLAELGIAGKALLVDDYFNTNLGLAARNNPQLKAVDALAVNVYDVVDRGQVVVSEGALTKLVEVLS